MTREKLGLDPRVLLGKSEIDANYECTVHGVTYHVVSRDGVSVPVTEDTLPEKRVGVHLNNGVVVGVAFDSEKYRPE